MKNKGFTLIEVLAAVVILGIISVTGGVAVSKIIENAREEHYVSAEKTFESAAQDFVQKNREYLPKYIGQKTEITLDLLVKNRYIQPIKDYQDNDCDALASKVIIFKYSQNDYKYTTYLECPSHRTKIEVKGTTYATYITKMTSPAKTAKFKLEDQDRLLSYSYVVYDGNREIKNSGSIPLTTYPTSYEIVVTYTKTPVRIVVSATDVYGNTKTETFNAS